MAGCITFEAVFHESDKVHREDWIKPVTAASSETGRTPAEERARLDDNEEQAKEEYERDRPLPQEVAEGEHDRLLDDLMLGRAKTFEDGIGFESLATGGLPPTDMADFAVVSGPGSDRRLYSMAVVFCALHGIGLAVVFESNWAELWFWVWKRNVERMRAAGKKLIVLTRWGHGVEPGTIGFAQSSEVQYLRERGHPFVAMGVEWFVRYMSPLGAALLDHKFEHTERVLGAPPAQGGVPLLSITSYEGFTPVHQAIYTMAPVPLLRRILEAGADANARGWLSGRWPQWAPLHFAAARGGADQVELLLEFRADASVVNAGGKTPLELVGGESPEQDRKRELLQ